MSKSKIFAMFVAGLFIQTTTAIADLPGAARVLLQNGSCIAANEICGDGIDQDCNGMDALCSGDDKDKDGFSAAYDCNDFDKYIYPGVVSGCWIGERRGLQACQTTGSYSDCSLEPVCQAVGGGRCYYISSLNGDDTNPGTFDRPWKSPLNFVSKYDPGNIHSVALFPGDVVYFFSGEYPFSASYGSGQKSIILRNVHGTPEHPITIRSYPGENVLLRPNTEIEAVYLLSSSHIKFIGLEISSSFGSGVSVLESSDIELEQLHVHDVYGVDNDNIAGLYILDATRFRAHHSLIHDNYDRINADTAGVKTENSRNIVLFRGGNTRIDHSVIFQTPPTSADKTGSCVTYKHSAHIPSTTFEFDNNYLWNCFQVSVGSGSFGTYIHHNFILNSGPIFLRDFGGPTHQRDMVVEKNTIIGGHGFHYTPTNTWSTVGAVVFRKNIVVDDSLQNFEESIVTIDPYGTDEMFYEVVVSKTFLAEKNCYYASSSDALRWNLFSANGGTYGVQGGSFTMPIWQLYGLDDQSYVEDPKFNSSFIPESDLCVGRGFTF